MYEKSTIFSLLPSQNHYFKSYICGSLFFQMAATQPNKHKDRRNGQANTDNLGNRKNLEIRVSAKIAPENLDDGSGNSIKQNIHPEKLPLKPDFFSKQPQYDKN